MAAYPMSAEQWYETLAELHQAIDRAQLEAAAAFTEWSKNSQGPIPVAANVDDLQLALTRHMEFAPDDEVEDELGIRLRAERFDQEHVNSMGHAAPYAPSFRYTQTRQYYDHLMEDAQLLLDENTSAERWMANKQTASADMQPPPSTSDAASAVAAALATYQDAELDEDITASEAVRDRLLVADGEETEDGEEVHAEPVNEKEAHLIPISDQEVVEAALILIEIRQQKFEKESTKEHNAHLLPQEQVGGSEDVEMT